MTLMTKKFYKKVYIRDIYREKGKSAHFTVICQLAVIFEGHRTTGSDCSAVGGCLEVNARYKYRLF